MGRRRLAGGVAVLIVGAVAAACGGIELPAASDDFSKQERQAVADLTRMYPALRWGAKCGDGGADGPAFNCDAAYEITGDVSPARVQQLVVTTRSMTVRARAYADDHWDGGYLEGIEPTFAESGGEHLIEPTVICQGVAEAVDFSLLVVADQDTPEVTDALAGGRCRVRPHEASDGDLYWYDTNASGFR